jgi:hypothetical protein
VKHLFNGDAAASVFLESGLAGDVVVWREVLPQGPAPDVDGDAWIETRTRFLSEESGEAEPTVDLRTQEEELRVAAAADDLLVWIEGDLSCQLTLAMAAHRLVKLPHREVFLISIDSFPGRPDFRGLGELTSEELMSLAGSKRLLSSEELHLFAEAWRCYRAPAPHDLARGVREGKFGLHLSAALTEHLRRFRSADGRPGSVERSVLGRLSSGESQRFAELFVGFQRDVPLLGFGDTQLLVELRRFESEGWITLGGPTSDLSRLTVTIAERGVAAAVDGTVPRTQSHWLGGVHVTPDNSLMWDERRFQFI